ncbi:MAG: DUF305 domain-containing protein [Gammaproteobacteria bacterium]
MLVSLPNKHQKRALILAVSLASSLVAYQSSAQAPIIQPGAPGQPSRVISAEDASNLASIQYSDADVKFMQGMISHHAQAVEMGALVEGRTNREAISAIAQRISISQEDEISMMQGWLEERGQTVPSEHAHHEMESDDLMPGMLSPEDFEALAQADGANFDTLFLQLMIEHHKGAIEMVENLLDQRGSAQDSVLYEFTTEVTSDQNSEIERMNAMLAGFSPDPRVNLRAGFENAGEASFNMELLATIPKPDGFFDPNNPQGLPMSRVKELEEAMLAPDQSEPDTDAEQDVALDSSVNVASETPASEEEDETSEPRPSMLNFANTDMTFVGDVLVAGNYHGFNAFDISNPASPQLLSSVVCPGGQGDVSVIGNLLIMSVEQTRGRLDCGLQGVAEPVSDERFRGIRIFDVSDFTMPVQVGAVQTCRGSHTHTVVTDPDDEGNIYIYGSGSSSVRPEDELSECSDDSPFENPESALFRIDVIKIPVDRPYEAEVVNRPFIFSDPEAGVLAGLWEGGDHGNGTQTTAQTNHCHDITAFPEIGMAAGACSGNGILLDISDPQNPTRIDQVIDTGFAYWHSATFNNNGSKVIFTDEWGGGSRPRCRASDPLDWGADAIYDIVDGKMQYRSHYKMSAPQTDQENCVAHNGSLIPVPGRDLFVQAWYQGGISVIDFTDSSNPTEIAFFDRGPVDEKELILGGYWSAYWYAGRIFGTEIARGLDVLTLNPSDYISANEIAAASIRTGDAVVNAQQQKIHVWPVAPSVALAYVDQLVRSDLLDSAREAQLRELLSSVEPLLASGDKDPSRAASFEGLAQTLAEEGEQRSGVSADRFNGLAQTLQGLGQMLR